MRSFMSRELLLGIPAKGGEPRLTEEQIKMNEDTIELFSACMNELCFVIKAQPFPYQPLQRKADQMIRLDTRIMKILHNRPNVTARVFDNDQQVIALLIQDWQKETRVQYKALFEFLREAEEHTAFEAFRRMVGLENFEETRTEERHRINLMGRRYSWIGGPSRVEWLYRELQFYLDWVYVRDEYKSKILARYAPH